MQKKFENPDLHTNEENYEGCTYSNPGIHKCCQHFFRYFDSPKLVLQIS